MYMCIYKCVCVYMYSYLFSLESREFVQAELKLDWNFVVHVCSYECNKSTPRV